MHSSLLEELEAAESDALLSTGEAAQILGASRQHVVNLCEAGDLPYTTTGSHRRIRRADLEALRSRTRRLTGDQRRSLWLSHAIAGKLVAAPEDVLTQARRNLASLQQRHTRGQAARWLAEWERILDGPVDGVLEALTSPSPRNRELRQNSPFAGVLTEEERAAVLHSFTLAHTSAS